MVGVLELQRDGCARAGSHLYARIIDALIDDHRRGGRSAQLLDPWAENALADAIPLRLLAGVHRIVLRGDAPDLARHYPSAGGDDGGDPVPAFLAVLDAHVDELTAGMALGVQTNEVGRACALVGGFHEVARRTGLPLRTLEVGASAGLLQHWDRYRYETATVSWGPDHGVRFVAPWDGAPPPFVPDLEVRARGACDLNPIDPRTEEGATTLRGFLWPDQRHRRARLDAAIEVARAFPTPVDAADAGAWVEDRLAEPVAGVATVVYHSIVLQYLPRPTFARMREAIERAGAAATSGAPIGWLRMEPAGVVADVRLRLWPGGEDRVLGTTDYHGPPVHWSEPG